jgi:hypothetical protein
MSSPLATIFHGDVNLEQGSDVTQFGWGDININRRCVINGSENSTCNTDGSLIVAGGVGITKTLNVHENFNVLYGVTRLTETHINTNSGPFTVTGGNTALIQVGADAQFVSTAGNININSMVGYTQLYGGLNGSNAVKIVASHPNGGVSILSGTSAGEVSIMSGSGGITEATSNGNVSITANNGTGSFYVNANSSNQNLTIGLNGNTDSQLRIESAGNNSTNTALVINTSNTNANIQISNANGLGNGSMSQLVGAGGYTLITNTTGSINMTSQGAGSNYIVKSAGTNQNMVIGVTNNTDSALILKSSGTNVTNTALQIFTTTSTGNISISQPVDSLGNTTIRTGRGGLEASTQTGGSIIMTAYGASSTYTNTTYANNQDLNVTVTGNTNSRVNISSSGTSNQAIRLNATNVSGGIYMTANGVIQLESSSLSGGIQIATNTSNVPVYIGTTNSTTTIYGNLDVKGVTTTIESTVVTIDDNMIIVNNAPSGTSDGGLAIKRYQSANNSASGDVVSDSPDHSGQVQSNSNTSTTVQLSMSANNTDDYYNGWWIKLTSGTGAGQVRRIRSYVGSTRIATIYSTTDQTGVLGNPEPIEGLDFLTIPDNTSNYSLYPCEYVMMIWDEVQNEFAFVCSNKDPATTTSIVHYSDLHINDLIAADININTINGSDADVTTYITLNNNSTTAVTITGFPKTYGVYLVFVKPRSDTSRTHGIFMIGRVDGTGIPGTVVRLISVKGMHNDQLDIQWPNDALPQLLYRPFPNGINGSTEYKLKIVSL